MICSGASYDKAILSVSARVTQHDLYKVLSDEYEVTLSLAFVNEK